MSAGGRALDGIKVLEVGSWIAGPAAATIMSDFGAEVIKVEPPGAGIPGLRTVMSPIQVADQTSFPATWAPDLGEHTDEVLRAAGYDAATIRRLRDLGVVA